MDQNPLIGRGGDDSCWCSDKVVSFASRHPLEHGLAGSASVDEHRLGPRRAPGVVGVTFAGSEVESHP